ncbi:hypothetical protein CapIbe_002564 [Capra ibex]
MPPPLPNHPSDTRAAASQHVGRSRCRNRGGLLGTNTDRTRHKETGRGVCCDRLARTQIVEAEAAGTVDPPEAREALQEASPDTLCATGSLAPTRIVTGRARASRYRRHPSTRQGLGTRGGL